MGFYTCALQQCVMCVWIFLFMNTYWLFSLPHHVFRSIYLCVCVCIYSFICIVYEYCTSMRVQKCRGGGPSRIRVSLLGVVRPPQWNRRHIDHAGGRLSQRPRAGATFCVVYSALLYTHTHTRTLFPIDRLSLSLFLFHSFCFKMY